MHNVVQTMLVKYNCQSERDYINALKEIFQEIALLGLWRAKFFEQAAFYGGTALRILYGLDRFSEDLDFSLLRQHTEFSLTKYSQAIVDELSAFGFKVQVEHKSKLAHSAIESAFIKANTLKQLLTIQVNNADEFSSHHMAIIKIKLEVDTNPPLGFTCEAKPLLFPIPFSVLTYTTSDLFAGKIHALLCRKWQNRIKGRDWYDYYWYISRGVAVNLRHLQERLIQSKHMHPAEKLSHESLVALINNKISSIDFNSAKQDVVDFLRDRAAVDAWSPQFFINLTSQLKSM
jgi:predicted nucleotidyltransferase component of viral defense system